MRLWVLADSLDRHSCFMSGLTDTWQSCAHAEQKQCPGLIAYTLSYCLLQEYVNALAGCMAEMPPGVQTTTPRMEQLLKEANSLIAGLVHVNPRTLREWHVLTNMESQDEGYDGPSKETLEAVVVRAWAQPAASRPSTAAGAGDD